MNTSLNELFDNRVVRIALVGVLSILALFLLVETISIAGSLGRTGVPATDTITVQGDGRATLAPDVARISFTVEHTASTVADAQSATTKQANEAIDYVKAHGVAEKDVKTLSYNISPQYSYPNPCTAGALCPTYSGAPKITGYQVSETIQITLRNVSAAGEMLGGLGKLGVQNLNGPDFALDDATSGYDAARADAIMKAKEQAALLAKQLGVHLGKIVTFTESSGGSPYPMMYSMSADSGFGKAAAPNVPVGENTYNASVSITYEIR